MAILAKMHERLLPLVKMANAGVRDLKVFKERYSLICYKEWTSGYALDKAFSRDIKVLIAAGLVEKEKHTITATRRTKAIYKQTCTNLRNEIFKIYINTTHTQILEGEHESTISENLSIYDQLLISSTITHKANETLCA